MQLNTLKRKYENKKARQVGRGGKRGKTSGKGTKGQNSRAGRKKRPELRDLIKKIPKLRGRGVASLKSIASYVAIVNISELEAVFSSGDKITPATLVEKGLISSVKGSVPKVKILGDGELTKKLDVSGCLTSLSAKEAILKMGGSVNK